MKEERIINNWLRGANCKFAPANCELFSAYLEERGRNAVVREIVLSYD